MWRGFLWRIVALTRILFWRQSAGCWGASTGLSSTLTIRPCTGLSCPFQHSLQVGQHLKSRLAQFLDQFSLIGDVRGEGLFLGIELVLDRSTLEPAPVQTNYVVDRMKEYGILLSSDGPWHNVIKIKPPLVFDQRDADRLVETLAEVLAETD